MAIMVAKEDQRTFDLQILKKQLVNESVVKLKVVSDSMVPLIKIGDLIEVQKIADLKELKHFDIIVFDQAGRLNVHFLTKIDHTHQQYITQCLKFRGENDYPLKPDQIIGLVKNKNLSLWQKMKVILVK